MKKAFSFIDVLISVAIASTIIAAVVALAVQNIAAADLTRDRFIAANLAQEAIEVVTNFRSDNWRSYPQENAANINADGSLIYWRGGYNPGAGTSCVGSPAICLSGPNQDYVVNYHSTNLTVKTAGNIDLYLDALGKYCQFGVDGCTGTKTKFSRIVTIQDIAGTSQDYQMKVVSTVLWTYNTRPYSVSVESRLYNWR